MLKKWDIQFNCLKEGYQESVKSFLGVVNRTDILLIAIGWVLDDQRADLSRILKNESKLEQN